MSKKQRDTTDAKTLGELRDRFAERALQGLVSDLHREDVTETCRRAWEYADGMLATRGEAEEAEAARAEAEKAETTAASSARHDDWEKTPKYTGDEDGHPPPPATE